jgi:hypothetical protein
MKMLRALTVALCAGLVAIAAARAYAQITEVVVRQGDSIEWHHVSGPTHRVRFGGTVKTPGGTVTLTPLTQIQNILEDFKPPLTSDGLSMGSGGQPLLTAKVKDSAAVKSTFTFTCANHPMAMISIPFRVEAAGSATQTIRIDGVAGFHWKQQPGNVHVDTTP